MKHLMLLFIVGFCSLSVMVSGDDAPKPVLPSATVKKVSGETVNTSTLHNGGKPIFVSFWATWCKPCIQELASIAENYDEWKQTGVKVIAISIDDARNEAKVAPFVKGRRWEFDVFLDPNGDFKRAMNVNAVPHSFLIDGNGKIISQHNSYAPGDEEKLLEEIKKITTTSETSH